MVSPLCMIQARYHSARLPGKMLKTLPYRHEPIRGVTLGPALREPVVEETLLARAWRIAGEAFGPDHCVVAAPQGDACGVAVSRGPLLLALLRIGARVFWWDGPESDVLGRFYHCAHAYRWHPDAVLVRYTPDDPFKTVHGLRRVAAGERLPVEIGGEAFTLAMLDRAHECTSARFLQREHLGRNGYLFPTPPPPCPPGVWTIDTQSDYDAARARALEEAT